MVVGTIAKIEKRGATEALFEIEEETGEGQTPKIYLVLVADAAKVILAKRDETGADIILERYVKLADFKVGMRVQVVTTDDVSATADLKQITHLTILPTGESQ